MVKRTKNGIRILAEPYVVTPPTATTIKTRLHLTPIEHEFLTKMGTVLGIESRKDYNLLCGDRWGEKASWKDRKKNLTEKTSSRWAGTITQQSHTDYSTGMRNLRAERKDLKERIKTIKERLNIPEGSAKVYKKGKRIIQPYRQGSEYFQKTRRLTVLEDRLLGVETRISEQHPKIVFGGGKLWKNKQNLDKTKLSPNEWERVWNSKRMFLKANGETGQTYGNGTISVSPEGIVRIFVPKMLQNQIPPELYNPKDPTHIVLSRPIRFRYKNVEWDLRVRDNLRVTYEFSYDPLASRLGKWYVSASWTYDEHTLVQPPLETLQKFRTLGVDLNKDHLAAWVVDERGNMVGDPQRYDLNLDGLTTSKRDALLRYTITKMLKYALYMDCLSISVEDLNFSDINKDTPTSTKKLRKIVSGLPTKKLRDYLAGMTYNVGVYVVAVDPAYTSMWGKQHWLKMLQHQYTPTIIKRKDSKNSNNKTSMRESTRVSISGHQVASGMIGRRMFGFKARRRMSEPPTRQRTSRGLSSNAGNVAERSIIQVRQQNQQTLVVPAQVSVSQQHQARADTPQDTIVGSLIPFAGQKDITVVLHPKNYY